MKRISSLKEVVIALKTGGERYSEVIRGTTGIARYRKGIGGRHLKKRQENDRRSG